MNCPLCNGPFKSLGQLKIFGKYPADYLRCDGCGFIQTSDPHWLKEAYATAITSTDIGPVWRADYLARITKSLIHAFEDPAGPFLDYGAGYGIFVRKLRDFGYDFRWLDKYSENLFAKGFEAEVPPKNKYQLVTAFEVFEHLPDPARQIAEIFEFSSEVFFTTDLVPQNPPGLDEWIYYGAEHGQHVAFYTEKSLRQVAQKAGLHFYTNGVNLHFFSRKKISPLIYRLVIRKKVGALFDLLYERPSLLATDYMAGRERILKAQQNQRPDRE
jgi:hypothetical protein